MLVFYLDTVHGSLFLCTYFSFFASIVSAKVDRINVLFVITNVNQAKAVLICALNMGRQ